LFKGLLAVEVAGWEYYCGGFGGEVGVEFICFWAFVNRRWCKRVLLSVDWVIDVVPPVKIVAVLTYLIPKRTQ
jgi:hypothetical protein